jgi:translation initiation factor IF-3
VRVIDAEGKMLGVMAIAEALNLAKAQGLDLIEIGSKASPPVVKILSYDKYRYQQDKAIQQQRKKQKKIEVKGIRLSIRIGSHDLAFKASQAEKFLQKASKVKIEMILRGRERANLGFAFEIIKKFLAAVPVPYIVEQEAKKLGNTITVVIGPKV